MIAMMTVTMASSLAARASLANRRRAVACSPKQEIRVCTGKTCKRMGSYETLNLLRELSDTDSLTIAPCGCLGEFDLASCTCVDKFLSVMAVTWQRRAFP